MAKRKGKRQRITYTTDSGQCREITLSSRYDNSVVEDFRSLVKRLSDVRRFGGELSRQDTQRLENLLPELRKKLIDCGLINGKVDERVPTIVKLIEQYKSTRVGIKDASLDVDKRIFNYLVEYFGGKKRIDLITPAEAGGIRNYLMNERTVRRGKLKPSSANRAIRAIKPIFRFAVDCGYIAVSPFAKVKSGSIISLERQEYISVERIEEAIAACGNDIELRGLLAITRFQGLRIPSEVRDLKFSDFLTVKTGMIFTVPVSGKTGRRKMPVFSEFVPYLTELQQHRKEGQEYLFEKYRRVKASGKIEFVNIGALIRKKMKRAGAPVWEKFFLNLRSSCITDKERLGWSRSLMDAVFGNSEQIRLKHYIQPLPDEEYAALGNSSAVQSEKLPEKLPAVLPVFTSLECFLTGIQTVFRRRINFSDIADIVLTKRGISKEVYNEICFANPVMGEISEFVNTLFADSYDDTLKRVSPFSIILQFIKNAVKVYSLSRRFKKTFTIPKTVRAAVSPATVEDNGLEPMTYWLPASRSPN
ncbi:hypothetical protein FACS189427_08160 [Planctomycetales bacterium]|nr:hypothetical protein FACS189427_08160 [Planctomycetales bacterium]